MSILKTNPSEKIRLNIGENENYALNCVDVLDGDAVDSVTLLIEDDFGTDISEHFSGDIEELEGVITFGVIGYAICVNYKITITIICNRTLPDGLTPRTLIVEFKLMVTE